MPNRNWQDFFDITVMLKLLLIIAVFINLTAACQNTKVITSFPSCIQRYIDTIKTQPNSHVGYIDEYEFQGKLVYAFGPSAQLRDGATFIQTADCKSLCGIGGFAGPKRNLCNGENFFTNAVLKRRIWPSK